MRSLRIAVIVLTGLVIVTMIGGTLLWKQGAETASDNRAFICLFSEAIAGQPVKQQSAETDREFRQRVELTSEFIKKLNRLDGCDHDPPLTVTVDPRSVDALGGDASTGTSPPSQPGPSPGGGGSEGNEEGVEPDPGSNGPPPDEPLIEVDPAQDCLITAAGTQICIRR